MRAKAREVNWDLTNNLLLILSLNQPLMKDLRIVATYLRAVDTVERLIDTHETSPVPTAHSMRTPINFHPTSWTPCRPCTAH